MTTLLRVTCPTAGDIPPAHQLRVWATDDRPVVLQLPPGAATARIVARLAAALPDFSVFDSGATQGHECVTVSCRGRHPTG